MKNFVFLLFILMIMPHQTFATPKLRALTYNVYAIPCLKDKTFFQKLVVKLFGRRCPVENNYAKTIQERLDALKKEIALLSPQPDVILIQEAFFSNVDIFEDDPSEYFQIPNYPYKATGPSSLHKTVFDFFDGTIFNPKLNGRGALNSGLIIFSKHPILQTEKFSFQDCEDSDCAATKGFLKVTINHPILGEIDIANTHLQAEDEFDSIRIAQIHEIAQYLSAKQDQRPLLFGGDFNFKLDMEEYLSYFEFKELFPEMKEASLNCSRSESCEFSEQTNDEHRRGKVWDHFFYNMKSVRKYHTPKWLAPLIPLSDHAPVLTDYTIP